MTADAYLTALNETAVALMDRIDPTELLGTIVRRAADLVGSPHGYVYVVDEDHDRLVMQAACGMFVKDLGYHLDRGVGVGGTVWETSALLVVPDYDTMPTRDPQRAPGMGSVIGIPLVSDGQVMGVLGLASGELELSFGAREIEVLKRFGELASLALDNARLLQSAQHEVEERTLAEGALRASEDRYRRLSDATSEALAIHRGGIILEVNAAFARLLGYETEDCVGRSVLDFAAPETAAVLRAGDYRMESKTPLEVAAMARDGTTFPVEVSWRHIPYPDGRPADVVAVRDLRERRQLEAELSRSAFYDGLTGLPNRALLLDRVSHALSFIRPDEDGPIGFILLDLDRFKVINESLGHAAGDRLLELVGRRLSECLRPGDTVARFGGDEFAVLLDAVRDVDDALHVAERIETELRAPFDLDGRDTFIGASMGIALGRAGSTEPGDLLRDAEIALYRAKADVSTRHALFEPGMSAAVAERLDLENDLRRAVERDELRLHYQPLVDLATGRIVGLEALVRWQHPTRGLVPPLSFIPLAEETGLILSIGRWVLETACRQARAWQVAFPTDPPILMSVNLSAKQFARADLVEQVSAILAETGLHAACLELEITESVLMDESDAGIQALQALRKLGVKLVLDDFGTGYSSLSYLKHMPLDTIKIDRSFVAELTGDDANLAIVQAVISLAHGLGIDVVAEGIETAAQLARLRELVCDRGQGYYYARPLPADELAELLRADRPLGLAAGADPTRPGPASRRPAGRSRPADPSPTGRSGRPRVRRDPALDHPIEPLEDDPLERPGMGDEPLQHQQAVAAPDRLGMHRDGQQAARLALPGVVQFRGPDLLDLGGRAHRPDPFGARLEVRPVVESPADRALPRADRVGRSGIRPGRRGHRRCGPGTAGSRRPSGSSRSAGRGSRPARGCPPRGTSTAPGSPRGASPDTRPTASTLRSMTSRSPSGPRRPGPRGPSRDSRSRGRPRRSPRRCPGT